ncbi:MAG: COP23 domain-containing protein [Nostoc sp. ChiSLP02]|nr:COP23 domain-containing protein [Nostoc sp. DedSLP05]MDZ8100330.1 COP23 domain-containing protein [Nostoc sp. DedSLP01]MDZ8188335.1 COP23 domain-containing protein [Nostoc sp. ChiSLP02]
MSSKLLRLISLGSLGLSLCLGNSAAMAQYDDSSSGDGVVVPTVPQGGSVPIDTSTGIPTSPSGDSTTRFTCQTYNGQYTVMYQPQSQPGQYFPWAAPATLGGGWDAERRCVAIASRLEQYRPDGLQELQTSVQNNQNIVCVTTEVNPTCRIVLTVPPGKDPVVIRNSIFQNLTTADSGQQTIAVNTYGDRSGSIYNLGRTLLGNGNNRVSSSRGAINLKPFLDAKDGGTARNLRNGVAIRRQSQPNSVRLNPGNFR